MPGSPFREKVIYPGWVDRKTYNLYLSSCDFFVLPLRNNFRNSARWPNKLSDYFVINRPVITNPVGDLKDIFTNNQLGVLCEESVDGFYDTVITLLENREKLLQSCAEQQTYVRNELDFDKRLERIYSLYMDISG